MLRTLTIAVLLATLFCSCKNKVQEQLLGKWHSVKIEESNWDEFFKISQKIIDTMGSGHSDAENIEIYGTANIDSYRREMQEKYDSAFAALKTIETGSFIHFLPDSAVTLGFPGLSESGKWHIDAEGHLVINEINKLGETQQMIIHINQLTSTEMKLVFPRDVRYGAREDSSVVTFRKENN